MVQKTVQKNGNRNLYRKKLYLENYTKKCKKNVMRQIYKQTTQSKLNKENCTVKTVQRKLYRENCTEKTVQRKLYRENCTKKTVKRKLNRGNCTEETDQLSK